MLRSHGKCSDPTENLTLKIRTTTYLMLTTPFPLGGGQYAWSNKAIGRMAVATATPKRKTKTMA